MGPDPEMYGLNKLGPYPKNCRLFGNAYITASVEHQYQDQGSEDLLMAFESKKRCGAVLKKAQWLDATFSRIRMALQGCKLQAKLQALLPPSPAECSATLLLQNAATSEGTCHLAFRNMAKTIPTQHSSPV